MLVFHMSYISWLLFFLILLSGKSVVSLSHTWSYTDVNQNTYPLCLLRKKNLCLRCLDYTSVDWGNILTFCIKIELQWTKNCICRKNKFNLPCLLHLVLFVLQFSLKNRDSEIWFCNNQGVYVHDFFAMNYKMMVFIPF